MSGGNGYTMTCVGCRKAIIAKGSCYDCAQAMRPDLISARTIQSSPKRFKGQVKPTKWGDA